MSQRERIMLACVVGLGTLWGTWMMYGKYNKALDARHAEVVTATSELEDAKFKLRVAMDSVKQMEAHQKRSLPSDREKALSLYKAWLLAKAKTAGLTVNDIKLAPRTTASTAFDAIGYQMQANGTLSNVVAMLYEFYHSPHLHQVTRLSLQRPPGSSQLQVTLDVEALCLKGAVATDSLPEGESKRLKLASAGEYQKRFAERDIASVYTPPKPPAPPVVRRDPPPVPPAPPKFDEAELAVFSGTTHSSKGQQAWINVRSTGETLHLSAGDPIKVGAFEGTIETVDTRTLVLKTGDKRYRVLLGKSLRSGKELDAEGNEIPTPAKDAKSST